MRRRFVLLCALLAFGLTTSWGMLASALNIPPPPRTYVTDQTDTLDTNQLASLEEMLRNFERETSNQVVVLLIPSLKGENLEDYAIRIVERWKPGQKGRDNGILLLIAKNDRKIRIEVGYGLEGALTDVLAGSIIRTKMAPKFRRNDFYGGVRDGVQGIIDAVQGEYQATPLGKTGISPAVIPIWIWVIFIVILVWVLGRLMLGAKYTEINRDKIEYDRYGFPIGYGSSRSGRFGSFGGGGFGGFSGGGGGFGGGGASGGW